MNGDARWLRRSRARQRAVARRDERHELLVELDARYGQAAARAALHAAVTGRGEKARRHSA
jgi:hypothetical protein